MQISLNYKELSKLVSSIVNKSITIEYKAESEFSATIKLMGFISLATVYVKLDSLNNNVATFYIKPSSSMFNFLLKKAHKSSKEYELDGNILKVYFKNILPKKYSFINIDKLIISKYKVDLFIYVKI